MFFRMNFHSGLKNGERPTACTVKRSYFWPRYRAKEVDDLHKILNVRRKRESPNQVWLGCEPFVIVKDMTRFEDLNSDALAINFPKLHENQLEEAQIGASSEDTRRLGRFGNASERNVGSHRLGLWLFNPRLKNKRILQGQALLAEGCRGRKRGHGIGTNFWWKLVLDQRTE